MVSRHGDALAMGTPGRTPTMRRGASDDDRPVDASSLVALGALALSNLALVILGLVLVVLGSRDGGKGVAAVFSHGGLDDALFEDPGTSAAVMGTLMMALAVFGLAGLYRRNKTFLMMYHVLALFMLIGIIYACAVMNIYKESSADMVRNYWMTYKANHNITGIIAGRVGRPTRLDTGMWAMQMAEARSKTRLFLRSVASCYGAGIFFLITSLGCSAYIMGMKYTGTHVGMTTNAVGIVFGLTLFVLCYFVARSTYNVPDAVSMKFDVGFVHEDSPGRSTPSNAHRLYETLRKSPDLIFETVQRESAGGRRLLGDSQSPPPAPSPPPSPPAAASPPPSSPPPPPPPPPAVDENWRARSVWVFEEGHKVIDNTHYNLTFKLALAGIDGDHVNEHFTDWAAKKVATFSEIQPEDVYVSQLKSGAEHKIGGIWTARFLAAAAFIVVFVNFFGLYSLYKDDRFLMAAHLCFSLAGILLLIISAALMGKHANATSRLIANNWHSIQNKVIGAGVEPVDAGAFARAHFKAAAALGTTVIILQLASIMSTLFSFFSNEPSYSLLSPTARKNDGGATGGKFKPVEFDRLDEEYGKRGFLSQERSHMRRGSDGVVSLGNFASPGKQFSID